MCICAILQYGNSLCRSNSSKRLCRSNSSNSNVAATVAIVAHVVNQASNTVHTLRTQNLYFCSKNLCIFLGQCGWILACGKTLLQLKIYICKDFSILRKDLRSMTKTESKNCPKCQFLESILK